MELIQGEQNQISRPQMPYRTNLGSLGVDAGQMVWNSSHPLDSASFLLSVSYIGEIVIPQDQV